MSILQEDDQTEYNNSESLKFENFYQKSKETLKAQEELQKYTEKCKEIKRKSMKIKKEGERENSLTFLFENGSSIKNGMEINE